MRILASLTLAILASSCVGGHASAPRWERGEALLQLRGNITGYGTFERSGPDGVFDGSGEEIGTLPGAGAGLQWQLADGPVALGAEGMLDVASRHSAAGAYAPAGGAAVEELADLDLLEVYGGPMAGVFVGNSLRVYGAAGPLVQVGFYDQTSAAGDDLGDSGFGLGWYARGGAEVRLGHSLFGGIGVRHAASTFDIGGDVGELELEGTTVCISVSWLR